MYRDCYLKFSSQKYNLRNYHESIHLTNNAVQKKYKNCDNRNDELPLNNMWHSDQYKKYLVGVGQEDVWDTVIYPGMRKSIVGVMLNCQDSLSECRHRFELYGCDFILDSKYNPWLIEINSCPDLQHTTPVTAKICPAVVSDIIKGKFLIYIVIDFAKNPNCSTGKFECIYRQPVTIPRYMLSGDLTVRGYSLPTDYFYRGQIEVKESYDNADIGKEKDINKIMKEMKKLYDEDVTLESEPDYLNLNTSKENIIVRDTHFTDSDIDETGGASSCSITEQLGDLLFNITPEKNSEPDGGETVNHLLIDSKYPEVPPKVETVLSKTLSTSKCSRSLIEDKSLDFGPVDDEPMSKVSGKRSHSVTSSTSSEASYDGSRNNRKKSKGRSKMDEVDRLAEMERQRRIREAEQKVVEEEAAKRIELLVKKRVEEELEKRKDEIEQEVAKRVEEAKRKMEKEMMEELERQREQQRREELARQEEEARKRKELEDIMAENNRRIEEAQRKLAEERLAMIEEQRKMDEEKQKLKKEQEKRVKEEQKKILGKNNSRPKLSFSLKPLS
ncbi:hypothetical protein MSG28_002065 [Choristoneura fumiferana]|uniref:Uncharacterized protein n=1 Tax=Choristoneura fumiferana TaxID=7141 RepID=A0ACC0JTQ9_CHOFU|nr:hypothetical protein MSG28_002065 [Choristoneura fumiferana]